MVCAIQAGHTATHVTGKSVFDSNKATASLVAAASDKSFEKLVAAVSEPLREMERELMRLNEHLPKGDPDPPPITIIPDPDEPGRSPSWYHRRLNNILRLVVEDGEFPRDDLRHCEQFHSFQGFCLGNLIALPKTARAVEKKLNSLAWRFDARSYRRVGLRGFLRFSDADFHTMFAYPQPFFRSVLPMRGLTWQEPPEPREGQSAAAECFLRKHTRTLHRMLAIRYARLPADIDFEDEVLLRYRRRVLARYEKESQPFDWMMPNVKTLCHLLMWYLMHFQKANDRPVNAAAIIARAVAVARRLRRRIARMHGEWEAGRIGVKVRRSHGCVVRRMQRLGRPVTLRELARGLKNQRLDGLQPMVDRLVRHGVLVAAPVFG